MSIFDRYIGIDYSGAQTPEASLPGLPVFSIHRSRQMNGLLRVLKVGFLGSHDNINSIQKVHCVCYSSHLK